MEKIKFMSEEMKDEVEFFVLEQRKINGISYILVTDTEKGDAQCLIVKDMSSAGEADSVYEIVDDDAELGVISKVFEELLEDVDIER